MNKNKKFLNFLESLKLEGNKTLIEHVEKGFTACLENEQQQTSLFPKEDIRGHYITTTYQTVTPESAKDGDYADQGWEDKEGESTEPDEFDQEEGSTVIDKTVQFLSDKGASEPNESGMNATPSWWSTTDASGTRDYYEKGEETYYSYHLNNYKEEEKAEIYKRMNAA